MKFSRRPRKRKSEHILPMINVVFLLLIFFLLSAQISQPVPFEITLPTADVKENPVSTERVYVSADGRIGYDGNIGDPAWSSLLEDGAVDRIAVHVDASVPGVELARIVKRLSEIGIGTVDLVTR